MALANSNTDPNYLFDKLPHYFKEYDSYVRNDIPSYEGQGFLERYLDIFCLEVDEQVTPYLDNIGYLFDATGLGNLPGVNTEDLLIHIADSLNNPPDIGTEDQYKVLLRYLANLLRVRGSKEGLDLYLALLGYKVSSTTIVPYEGAIYDGSPTPFKYDDGWIYDGQNIFYFDMDLVITDYDGIVNTTPTNDWLDLLKQALQSYIMPITINLLSVTYI